MADYTKSPVFSSPAYWIALTAGVVGIGAAAMQEGRKGSAATTRMRGAGSMTRIPKVTQKRLDKDEALFERRFGGLVMDEDGNTITIEEDTDFDDSLEYYLDQHVLWTHVDGDGGTYLLPGLHRVNRIEYYISARPWTDADLNTVQIAWTK